MADRFKVSTTSLMNNATSPSGRRLPQIRRQQQTLVQVVRTECFAHRPQNSRRSAEEHAVFSDRLLVSHLHDGDSRKGRVPIGVEK